MHVLLSIAGARPVVGPDFRARDGVGERDDVVHHASPRSPAPSIFPDRRLSMGKRLSSTKAGPIFPNSRLNLRRVVRTGWFFTPSTFCGGTATFASCPRSSGS